ncbi:uncharacterized protein PADG_07116 [Paracoccidioides brasiliensis Pb18]|uniref:54S ribosomal protein L31, mitochondrial n=2 Tax=Paracoccidioides brasiliensis TaxID=121759 RepID=C1GIN0_PARBD|nr:uncharacterized protein PADG_07116 [Paracoccidioides brasiliensis Pb18]EEH42296.2 hypothetical protein PADG_07116 [Paracoccidioides brasiliensis Pb18]
MFKPTSPLMGGLLWKIPWRLSAPQKARQRKRLRAVDKVVDTVSAALERKGMTSKAVTRWFAEMPREEEMLPKDKYTIFDRKEKKYRKGIHSMFFLFPSSPNGPESANESIPPDSERPIPSLPRITPFLHSMCMYTAIHIMTGTHPADPTTG